MKKILTLTEVSQYLGIAKRTLYDMLSDGRFSVRPIPGMHPRRWNIDDLDLWRNGEYK